jgi:hypothetical protein
VVRRTVSSGRLPALPRLVEDVDLVPLFREKDGVATRPSRDVQRPSVKGRVDVLPEDQWGYDPSRHRSFQPVIPPEEPVASTLWSASAPETTLDI